MHSGRLAGRRRHSRPQLLPDPLLVRADPRVDGRPSRLAAAAPERHDAVDDPEAGRDLHQRVARVAVARVLAVHAARAQLVFGDVDADHAVPARARLLRHHRQLDAQLGRALRRCNGEKAINTRSGP